MKIYVATSNAGKLRDFAYAATSARNLAPPGEASIEILPLPGLAAIAPPPEEEPTFEGNAREKAIYYSQHEPGLWVIADDSGLEVSCLDDAPGVRSARYAEDQGFPSAPGSTLDERNNAALLRSLDAVPPTCRGARYRCALALARDGKVLAVAEGTLEGTILIALRGTAGFGYDPLFLMPEFDQTMAEVNLATRLDVSHRGRALRSLLAHLPPL